MVVSLFTAVAPTHRHEPDHVATPHMNRGPQLAVDKADRFEPIFLVALAKRRRDCDILVVKHLSSERQADAVLDPVRRVLVGIIIDEHGTVYVLHTGQSSEPARVDAQTGHGGGLDLVPKRDLMLLRITVHVRRPHLLDHAALQIDDRAFQHAVLGVQPRFRAH